MNKEHFDTLKINGIPLAKGGDISKCDIVNMTEKFVEFGKIEILAGKDISGLKSFLRDVANACETTSSEENPFSMKSRMGSILLWKTN